MSDAMEGYYNLRELTQCRCHEAFKDRDMVDPDCHCQYREDVEAVADEIRRLDPFERRALAAERRLSILSTLLSEGHGIEVACRDGCACGSCWEYQIRDNDGDVYATGEGLDEALDAASPVAARYTLTDAGRAALEKK